MVRQLRMIATLCVLHHFWPNPSASSPTSAATTTTQPPTTPSPANSIGMFAYPNKQQSADQQLKDENECFDSAKQQSGVDPQAPPPAAKTEEQKKAESRQRRTIPSRQRWSCEGSAKGAARGAAIGAIALLEPLPGQWWVEQRLPRVPTRPFTMPAWTRASLRR